MASWRWAKRGFFPYGVWVDLTHDEICVVKNIPAKDAADKIKQNLGDMWWVGMIAMAIVAQFAMLQSKNESSGGQGCSICFNFLVGMITNIDARGSGPSPCK